jgi:beta-galactosidase/beta-glucuronidase
MDSDIIMKREYPRPDFVRNEWMTLNGQWEFEFDDNSVGIGEEWYHAKRKFNRKINVPFAYQAKLSGIGSNDPHSKVWYKRQFTIPATWRNKRIYLNFGAVDYQCKVFINGKMAGLHEGGHTSFSLDITDYLTGKEELLAVYVEDEWDDQTIPRGKQFWRKDSWGIWYTRTTGIWQSVWLEPKDTYNIQSVKFTPDVDKGTVTLAMGTSDYGDNLLAQITITFEDTLIAKEEIQLLAATTIRTIDVFQGDILRGACHGAGWCWTPEKPNLFTVELRIVHAQTREVLDFVATYFGMRKIHAERGVICLNNQPYYQKLVLDQGYWPDGLLTAPSDEDYITDIRLAKEMGFNGCRKHQKVEDPRFLYWADKLGFLVWGEMANSASYNVDYVRRMTQEWFEIIERDYNHPCIVTWVPLNESWGVPNIGRERSEMHHSQALYHQIHSLDHTRLVVSNDGWEMTETDICAIHNYNHGLKNEQAKYEYFKKSIASKEDILKSMPAGRAIYANGFTHRGEPIVLTEFGGIAFEVGEQQGWGYTVVNNEADFIEDYERIMVAVLSSKILYGFCYTQLTDVEQEINGLLTYDRKPKCKLEVIRAINNMWRNNIAED